MLCTIVLLDVRSVIFMSKWTTRSPSASRHSWLDKSRRVIEPILTNLSLRAYSKNTNRKTGKCKTLWFIYIKILVCHFTYIYIYIQLLSLLKWYPVVDFFSVLFLYTLTLLITKGLDKELLSPLMHIRYIQFVQFCIFKSCEVLG